MAQSARPYFPYIFPSDHEHDSHTPDHWLLGLKSMDSETEKCYIHKITYFKDRKPSFHEYLLTEIVHPGSVQASFAITERAPDKTDDSATKQAVSPSIYGRVAANDTVRVFGGPGISKLCSCNKLAELTFEPNKLPLLNLAVLLTVVSKHAPSYDVWEYQCYWYAGTIYQSAKALFKPSMEHVEPALSRRRGKYLLKLPPRKDSVEAIIGEYNAAMEDIRKEKIRKTNARLAEEKKVSFLDSTVILHVHVFTADRATRPRNREKRAKGRRRHCVGKGGRCRNSRGRIGKAKGRPRNAK